MKENIDYTFVMPTANSGSDANFKFLIGDFKDVEFTVSGINVEENEETKEAFINFNFDVIDSAGISDLEKNEDFKNSIGSILISIVESQYDKWSAENENRADDSKTSDI